MQATQRKFALKAERKISSNPKLKGGGGLLGPPPLLMLSC